MMLFSPFIMTLKMTYEFCLMTKLCGIVYCQCGDVLGILINLAIAACHLLLAFVLAALYSPYSTFKCIQYNSIKFMKIRNHWSSKNRIDGQSKAELFKKR